MKIGFIGAGKVGCVFGKYLKNNGYSVMGYYSRSKKSAELGAKGITGKVYHTIGELVKECDVVFITTPDDAIEKIALYISKEEEIRLGQIFVHMSGALSSDVLVSLKEKGAYVYSLHPLQAFSDIESAYEALPDTVFSFEGDNEKKEVICEILEKCGNTYFEIEKEQKPIYHAAACVVSNYLVTLLDYGFEYFRTLGLKDDITLKALYPLILGTVNNVKRMGPANALTGPIARGDVNTVGRHIENLKEDAPDLVNLYSILGMETLKLAEKEKLKDKEVVKDLKNILKEVLK